MFYPRAIPELDEANLPHRSELTQRATIRTTPFIPINRSHYTVEPDQQFQAVGAIMPRDRISSSELPEPIFGTIGVEIGRERIVCPMLPEKSL